MHRLLLVALLLLSPVAFAQKDEGAPTLPGWYVAHVEFMSRDKQARVCNLNCVTAP
jgi:hypothetical protein